MYKLVYTERAEVRAKEQAGVILQPVTEPMAANDLYFELKI